MAALQHSRNILLNSATTRVEGGTVTISSGGIGSIVVQAGGLIPEPSSITLTATTTLYKAPTFAWEFRYGTSGNWTNITTFTTTGTSSVATVTLDAAWLTASGTNYFVQYRVIVTETGINTSTVALSLPILRNGQSAVTLAYTNDALRVPVDATTNVATWTGSGGELFVYEGAQKLVLDSNTQSTTTPASVGRYVLDITKVSGDTLTEPTITGSGTNTTVLSSWAGTITQITVYRITAYIKLTGGTTVTAATDVYIAPSSDPALYEIKTSSPVIVRDSYKPDIPAQHTSITIQGRKIVGDTVTNYGWISVYGTGDTPPTTAIDTSTGPITLAPANNAGKSSYTIVMYNQATVAGATILDIQIVEVVPSGRPAKNVDITGLTNFKVNSAGTISPANATLTAVTQNIVSPNYSWAVSNATPTSGSGSSITITPNNAVQNVTVTVTVTEPSTNETFTKSATLSLAYDGTNGTNGTNGAPAINISLSNYSASLTSYANGGVPSFANANGQLKVFSGSTDVTSSATLSATPSTGVTGTINTADNTPVSGKPKGYYEVTALTQDTGTLTLTAVYNSITYTAIFSIGKLKIGYEIVASLPTTNLFEGRVVFLSSDGKLYRYVGSAWTSAVPALDISGQLADAQVAALAASKITGQLTDAQIATLDAAKIAGQLSDSQLAAISATKLTGQITGTQITNGAISTAKIAAGAITSNEIAAGSIVAGNIAAGAITTPKIAAGAITSNEIAANSIVAGNIAAGAITTAKIETGAVTANLIAANSITSAKIVSGAITADKILANSITANEIAANTITANNIAAGTITAAKIASNTITGDLIAANTISVGQLKSNTSSNFNGGSFGLGVGTTIRGFGTIGSFVATGGVFGLIVGDDYTGNSGAGAIAGVAAGTQNWGGQFHNSSAAASGNYSGDYMRTTAALATGSTAGIIKMNRLGGSPSGLAAVPVSQADLGNSTTAGGFTKWTNNYTGDPGTLRAEVHIATDLNAIKVWTGNTDLLATTITTLGVGTATFGGTGEIRATGNITAYYSDDRLKTRIGIITDALNKVCELSGFYYKANETAEKLGYSSEKLEVGVSAQAVQKVLPEIVTTAPISDEYLTVRYERLTPLLIEAIKELRSELNQIKDYIDANPKWTNRAQ